jgi:hypothetical protein
MNSIVATPSEFKYFEYTSRLTVPKIKNAMYPARATFATREIERIEKSGRVKSIAKHRIKTRRKTGPFKIILSIIFI